MPVLVNLPKTTPTDAKLSRLTFEALLAIASLQKYIKIQYSMSFALLPHVIDAIFVETEDVRFITSVNQKGNISTDTANKSLKNWFIGIFKDFSLTILIIFRKVSWLQFQSVHA